MQFARWFSVANVAERLKEARAYFRNSIRFRRLFAHLVPPFLLPSRIEYRGEFGVELICFTPFVYWLHLTGRLENRVVSTYAGMRSIYYFLPESSLEERNEKRDHVHYRDRPLYLPNPYEHRTRRSSRERFPDYRSKFREMAGLPAEKPLLIVNNKYCIEFGWTAMNFITPETLEQLFSALKEKYQIVYIREGLGKAEDESFGYSGDHNLPYPDFHDDKVLERHPEVIPFYRLQEKYRDRYSYNELKLRLFANCKHYISSQGGGNYLCAFMPASILLILHRMGNEVEGAYTEGFYRYISNLSLLVASTGDELVDAAAIFSNPEINNPANRALLDRYDPQRLSVPNLTLALPTRW